MAYFENADAQGQLMIGEHLSPVSYRLEARQDDRGYAVRLSVQAPRDWLLQQGFERRAMLVLASGERAEVVHEDDLDVTDSLRVVLQAEPRTYPDHTTLTQAFPELLHAGSTAEGGAEPDFSSEVAK